MHAHPSRALELIAYQCHVGDMARPFSPQAWLDYNTAFRMHKVGQYYTDYAALFPNGKVITNRNTEKIEVFELFRTNILITVHHVHVATWT